MYIKKLTAKNFRNIEGAHVEFEPGINVLYGQNASGKTNALEGIYLFASGKSLRGSPEKDFIRRGAEVAELSMEFCSDMSPDSTRYMSYRFYKGNKKSMRYGGVEVPRMSEFLGLFRSCMFTPDDLLLVKGSPEERRRFIDISVSQISPRFVHYLNDYARLLSQKNMLLRAYAVNGKIDKDYLFILNEKLAECSGVIVKQRSGFCENLYKYASGIYSNLSEGKEALGMKYVSQSKHDYGDEEYTKRAYLELYEKSYESDLRNGVCTVGPHRDDIHLYIGKNEGESDLFEGELYNSGHTARAFGSRGQQRSAVLALKLAQGELFREICGEYPVFLLDDVFSELDYARRKYILSETENRQVIITCCDCDVMGEFRDYHGIWVEDGKYKSN